ncbi:MAG TPA: hypothetical protein VKD90_24975 [Gemmataceae bacterium]|nr:hypothetical protein [Gemmataceae bacterium]
MTRRHLAWLLALVPAAVGCHHFTPCPCDKCYLRPVDEIPDQSKNCIYIFLIDHGGLFESSDLPELRRHLLHIGFVKTYYGSVHHAGDMMVEMGTIAAERPGARFVVIGYGAGADAARELAGFGETTGTPVEVAIYLEPKSGEVWAETGGALSTITVRAADLVPAGPCPEGVKKAKKSAVATHPETLEIIERELALVGMTIPPPVRPEPKKVYLVEPMPPPREREPHPKPLPPDWQFLRPRHPLAPPLPRQRPDVETLPMPRVVEELPPPKSGDGMP